MGLPKALVRDERDGTPWLHRSLAVLRDGGCERLVVVAGAAHEDVSRLLADDPRSTDVELVVAPDWAEGMGASLRAGLRHLAEEPNDGGPLPEVAVVSLVDLPDVGADVVRRLLQVVSSAGTGAATLARAAYGGVPGHPVVLGRDHWPAVTRVARGDRGARDLLADRQVRLVESGDLATGADRDTPRPAPHLTKEAPRG